MHPGPPPVPQAPLQPPGLYAGLPPRPVYREPHSITAGTVISGLAASTLWLVLFGSLGGDLVSYAWWTILAAVTAWLVAVVLTLVGDRGVALGVACASGLGLSLALGLVAVRWIDTANFPLW
ncbi:hypothetical protein [Actinoplanes regularis]|uniref:Uncharacterized protein n=1 Tax=Actinoplanes regularis TaxID=52697 RepID=A0A239ASU8_9ACTN|nr:hypothetical protein [Actinoplanes regularis]GIE87398.1 hypothetical protein Are01nite_38780 [Actinoplanes regularis]SNR98421.1 hypothetical protein SAMN06264365_10888 [Actinoplanes regularis]